MNRINKHIKHDDDSTKLVKSILRQLDKDTVYKFRLLDNFTIKVSVVEDDEHKIIKGYDYTSLLIFLFKWVFR